MLDAGCGQGTAFAFFGPDTHVFGSDISFPMLHDAVKRGPVTVQEPYQLPFADDTFDAVYAFCIYHHIPDEDHVRHLSRAAAGRKNRRGSDDLRAQPLQPGDGAHLRASA